MLVVEIDGQIIRKPQQASELSGQAVQTPGQRRNLRQTFLRPLTHSYPKNPGPSGSTGKSVPQSWWEAASSDSNYTQKIQPKIQIVDPTRVVRESMINRREPKAQGPSQEEKRKHRPIVGICPRILAFGIGIDKDGKYNHPDGRQQVAVDTSGLIVKVETATKAFEIRIG